MYSTPGKGTTFKIYIPHFEDNVVGVIETGTARVSLNGNETVLLVEDDPAILKIEKSRIELLGYKVLAANTPQEAIRLAHEYSGKIHLLLTDVVMPEMNGKQLAELLVVIRPGLKRLFVSGYTADIITQRGVIEIGINFIQKPCSINELALKIRQALDMA